MVAASLIDTNVLVYRFDTRFPKKQAIATKLLREGLSTDSIRIPHQAVLEFMAVVTRVRIGTEPLLTQAEARRETEEFLDQFRILFPDTVVVRTALRGAATYQLPWFDAHLCGGFAFFVMAFAAQLSQFGVAGVPPSELDTEANIFCG